MTENSTIGRAADVLEATLDDEVILLSIARGNYYSLDDIAGDVWRRLVTPGLAGELFADLSRDYDASPATVARDVLPLLRDMASQGLIDVAA